MQLTDLAPVDGGIYFDGDTAMIYADDDEDDVPVSEVVSGADGIRTYLYTKFELVSVARLRVSEPGIWALPRRRW